MIPKYLSVKKEVPATGYWDHAFLRDLFEDINLIGDKLEREVFIIPGAYQSDMYYEINEEINKFPKIMVFITSDEEGKFDPSQLYHPDMIVYAQYGNGENLIPLGYTTETRSILKEIGPVDKVVPWFFSGQITHKRRQMMENQLMDCPGGLFVPTDGFAKGLPQKTYLMCMAMAMAAPCPPGPISHDSFRLYEALEAGTVPVVDEIAHGGRIGYWQRLFPDKPFFSITSYDELKYFLDVSKNLHFRNKVYSWWIREKLKIKDKIKKQLGVPADDTTVVLLTSPIPSHPSTEIIEETIRSIRFYTNAKIIIGIDGVREEQKDMTQNYEEYIYKLLWKCNFEYKNVYPIVFDKHMHQSGMMREILPLIETPLLLFMEHDTPLVTDLSINWSKILDSLVDKYNLVRFHYEAFIPEEHKYLMVGAVEDDFQKTIQFSARPHLARTDFYRRLMQRFSAQSNCFIEDRAYGQIVEEPWENWKMVIYHPEGVIKRSLNLDGRNGSQKYDSQQIW